MTNASGELRKALFDAVDGGDLDGLSALCEAHERAIVDAFPSWRTVPEGNRVGPGLRWYVQGMSAVAQHMAAMRGKPELLELLTQASGDTQRVIAALETTILESDRLLAAGRVREAISRAETALASAEGIRTPLTSILLGRLGQYWFHLGDLDRACQAVERALAECEVTDDLEGKLASLESLCEVQRYRGNWAGAADLLSRMADLNVRAGRSADADRLRRRAALVRAGEPLCRVALHLENGETVELDDAPVATGRIQLVYLRNRPTLPPSLVATGEGERAGAVGDYERALEAFRRASAADPFDPSPVYQAGVALLYMDRPAEAAAQLRRTDSLAPGWYRCRAYAWLAERIAAGTIPPDAFLLETALDRPGLDPEAKARLAEQGIMRTNLSLFHGVLGDAHRELGRLFEARASYRRGLGLAEEPDVRTQLLVKLGGVVEDAAERVALFEEAVALGGNLTAAAAAKLSLAMMRRG